MSDLPKTGQVPSADAGVALVKFTVSKEQALGGLGCMFRETASADVGIDGSIEIVVSDENGARQATGRIVSVQVKTGVNPKAS